MAKAGATPTTSRRRFLAATAATAALPLASIAAPADPAFAAIAAHKKAFASYSAALLVQERWETQAEAYQSTPRYAQELAASEAAVDAIADLEADELQRMEEIVPTSLAGAAALIDYVRHLRDVERREVFEVVDPYRFVARIERVIRAHIG